MPFKKKLTILKLFAFLVAVIISFIGVFIFQNKNNKMNLSAEYLKNLETFRSEADVRIKSPEGWLSVVGLTWLKNGVNKIGSDPSNEIVLPMSAPAFLGQINFFDPNATKAVEATAKLKFNADISAKKVLVDGAQAVPQKEYDIFDDHTDKPTKIKIGPVSFQLINRKNGVGARIRDENSKNRLSFKNRDWYPPHSDFIVDAEWIAHVEPKKILIPDVLGNLNEEVSPGFARFQIDGETIELHPTQSDDELFFVFRDQTAGRETYGAARFLYANARKNGRVTLDFNRAVNPPCAFTEYATCPMPIKENVMKVAIRAGELKPVGLDH